MSETIDKLNNLYGYYRQKYVLIYKTGIRTVGRPFTGRTIGGHLMGACTIGVFAGERATRFISVDVDDGGKPAVRKVIDTFAELGIPRDHIYPSMSGKKGYHVDIFFAPFIYNRNARNLYDLMIWRSGLDPKKVEFRPTHTQAIKIPLGIHQGTGTKCWYVDRDTLEPIEREDYINEIESLPASIIYDIFREWNPRHWKELYTEMVCDGINGDQKTYQIPEVNDEYLEKHRLTEGGTRHDTMLKIARDMRLFGAEQADIVNGLLKWYRMQDQSLISTPEKDVIKDIDEIAAWAAHMVSVLRKARNIDAFHSIVFDKEDINYILLAPTKTARKIALLIWTYCKIYGECHISYDKITEIIGCVNASAINAISDLVIRGFITKDKGGLRVSRNRMLRIANTYHLPEERTVMCPPPEALVAESYTFSGYFLEKGFDDYYYRVLAGICTEKYLRKFLTKTELEGCRNAARTEAEERTAEK